jgi:PAS domain S-box-containing protein
MTSASAAGQRDSAVLAFGVGEEELGPIGSRDFRIVPCSTWVELGPILAAGGFDLVVVHPSLLAANPFWIDFTFLHPETPWVALGSPGPENLAGRELLADTLPSPLDEGGRARLRTALRLGRAQRQVNRLRRTESKLDLILANAPDVIYSLDAEGVFTSISHAVTQLLGYTPQEVVGTSVFPMIHQDDREKVVRGFRQSLETREPFARSMEFRLIAKDGCVRHCEVNRKMVYENGRFVESQGIARDLTRIRRAEDQLRAIVAASPLPLVVSRASDGRVLYANESMARICGVAVDGLLGRCMPEFYWDASERTPLVESVGRDGAVNNRDLRIRRADGEMLWVQLSVVAAELEGERVLICGLHDIHQRKQAEDALRVARAESESLVRSRTSELARANGALHALLDAIPDHMFRVDSKGNFLDNRAPRGCEETMPSSSFIGRHISEAMPPEMADSIMRTVAEALRTGAVQSMEYDQPGKAECGRFEARVAVCGENEALAIIRDITDRKKHEDQLFRSHEELERRVKERTSQLGHINIELMAEINERRATQEALAVRLRYEEALSSFSQELIEGAHSSGAVEAALAHLLKASGATNIYVFENFQDADGGMSMRLMHAVNAPGTPVHEGGAAGDVSVRYADGLERWKQELSANRPIQGTVESFPESERRILQDSGFLSLLVLPLRTNDAWSGLIGFGDNRERREWTPEDLRSLRLASEVLGIHSQRQRTFEALDAANRSLRETSSRLTQSEKMASLGMLVAGIAHEINTPLGAIHSMNGTSRLALDKLKAALCEDRGEDGSKEFESLPARVRKPIQALEDAEKILASGTQRVIGIVKRLRSFARLDQADLQHADLREGMDDTLALIQHELKRRITVVKEYGDIPPIPCYPNQLNQVFLNLLVNAIQAIKGNGTVTIAIGRKGKLLNVAISDTGQGIPKENLIRIFDPGFTTKGVGVGTGLGLSICYQIVADHRGEIRVDSVMGKGSTFTVSLPIVPAAKEKAAAP